MDDIEPTIILANEVEEIICLLFGPTGVFRPDQLELRPAREVKRALTFKEPTVLLLRVHVRRGLDIVLREWIV